jgi:ABC-2 type transport system ATP-binding protein
MTTTTTAPAEPSLELHGIEKPYGDFRAVQGVSLRVPPGTIFGLLGPNGAGKTTTIRMIMDIIAPDAGEILFFGRPRTSADLESIGYLPEERGLYQKMKVIDHLVFLGELRGLAHRQARERSEHWLTRLDLADRADKKVEELSKGMQQKIQLAGTVLHDPKVVILDEPFSGLDPINQNMFKEVLAQFRDEGRTILFSTHVMEQAEKLCDHIALISKGRTVLEGRLAEIKRQMGGNAYRLVAAGDLGALEALPGIEQAVLGDGEARLLLSEGATGAEVLRGLVTRYDVTEFRSEEPELQDIFIKAVRDAA